jgi:hypothetical protein
VAVATTPHQKRAVTQARGRLEDKGGKKNEKKGVGNEAEVQKGKQQKSTGLLPGRLAVAKDVTNQIPTCLFMTAFSRFVSSVDFLAQLPSGYRGDCVIARTLNSFPKILDRDVFSIAMEAFNSPGLHHAGS